MAEGTPGFIPAAALDKIAIERPKEVTPKCTNCPFHAVDPIHLNAPKQCRESLVSFILPGPTDKLGRQQMMIMGGYPEANGPCGKHPLIRAKAEAMYQSEVERLHADK